MGRPLGIVVTPQGPLAMATVAALLPEDLHWRVADPGETPMGSPWWHMGRWCVYSLHYPFVRLVLYVCKENAAPGLEHQR